MSTEGKVLKIVIISCDSLFCRYKMTKNTLSDSMHNLPSTVPCPVMESDLQRTAASQILFEKLTMLVKHVCIAQCSAQLGTNQVQRIPFLNHRRDFRQLFYKQI